MRTIRRRSHVERDVGQAKDPDWQREKARLLRRRQSPGGLAFRRPTPKTRPHIRGATGFDVGRETPGACRGARFLVKPLANN
jgi:hypothetical protein